MEIKRTNQDVNPFRIERAIKNGGRYEHTVPRLVGDGDNKRLVEIPAETVITSPNTAEVTLFADAVALFTAELHKTDFVRRMWAVYTT